MSHPAISAFRAQQLSALDQTGRAVASQLLGDLDCNCPSRTGYRADYQCTGSGQKKISRWNFVKWPTLSTPPNPIPDIISYLSTDWTFAIGGHFIDFDWICMASAECNAPPPYRSEYGYYTYYCSIKYTMKDRFQDPFDIQELLVGVLGRGMGDLLYGRLLQEVWGFDPRIGRARPFVAQPYSITGSWSEAVIGDGAFVKSKQGCITQE